MAGGHLNRRVPQLRVAGKNTVLFDDGIAEDVFFAAIQVPKVAKSYCNVPGLVQECRPGGEMNVSFSRGTQLPFIAPENISER
jgi:hypothetical protein